MNPLELLSMILGYLMDFCYGIVGNWWVAIILFTAVTKVILLPLSLWCQKNSVKMVEMMPEINRIKVKYFGDKETIGEEQAALFKREHYHGLLSLVPLAIQIIILMGLIDVIYTIAAENPSLSLGLIPFEVGGFALVMPLIAGFAAICLSFAQNRIHPLQKEQSRAEQMTTNGISIAISFVLGVFVPMGVGFYWACSNILSILVQVVCNIFINPKKSVDYDALEESRKELSAMQSLDGKKWYQKDENRKREKADYKKFFNIVNKHLVFYSEASGFYKYFKNIIEYLLAHSNVIIHYVTNDPNDQIFEIAKTEPRIRPYYIGLKRIITLFMKMDADIVVMTTPDLDNYYLKRSYVKKDIEYIYLQHGPTSLIMCLREGAVDNFDTVFCVGQPQIDEIRATEQVYNLKPKTLFPCGYGLMDTLLQSNSINPESNQNGIKRILVAPSYQPDNILDSCLDKVIEQLGNENYCLIIRPHPEYIKRFPKKIEAMYSKYQDRIRSNFIIEGDFSSNTSIFSSDMLITDWSGIAYEFSYTTKKPSLFINTPMKVLNPNYAKIGVPPLDITLRDKVGVSLNLDELDSLGKEVENLFKNQASWKPLIEELMQKSFFNLGKSGEAGGQYLLDSLIKKQHENDKN